MNNYNINITIFSEIDLKNKNYIITIPSCENTVFDCALSCAAVNVFGTDGNNIEIEHSRRCHVKVSADANTIKIKQIRKPLFRKTEINIYVPNSCLADISIKIKHGSVKLDGGEFKNLNVECEDAEIGITSCNLKTAVITGQKIKMDCADVSVNDSFICVAENGEVIAENSNCTKTDMTFEYGNMGMSGFKCRDSAFRVKEGSINICLHGAEDDYSLRLLSPNGTCNRENVSGGTYELKAYTGSGNIVVDFANTCTAAQGDLACGA